MPPPLPDEKPAVRVRVLVAAARPPVRAGVREALGAAYAVCAEAETAPTAVAAARLARPDVCLVDAAIPGGALEAASNIAAGVPDAEIVLLGAADDEAELRAALRAGASGYLLAGAGPARLGRAVRSVLGGDVVVPKSLLGGLVEDDGGRPPRIEANGRQVRLTHRQWEVLEHVRRGRTTAEIARRLSVAEGTVRRHVFDALKKLGVRDRAEAVALLEERAGPARARDAQSVARV